MVASHNFVEHILTTFRLATEANRHTPGRQGNVVELSPELAVEVMVTGDLHGHRQNFNLFAAWPRSTRTPAAISCSRRSATAARPIRRPAAACRTRSSRIWRR